MSKSSRSPILSTDFGSWRKKIICCHAHKSKNIDEVTAGSAAKSEQELYGRAGKPPGSGRSQKWLFCRSKEFSLRAGRVANVKTSHYPNDEKNAHPVHGEASAAMGFHAFQRGQYSLAFFYYEMAVGKGDIIACHNLAVMLLHGQGIPRNYIRARENFLQCASQGLLQSMSQLGYMYYYGRGVSQDYRKAAFWFMRASLSMKGDAYSQFHLGIMYLQGWGLPSSINMALTWLARSADAGFGPALYTLACLYLENKVAGEESGIELAIPLLKKAVLLGKDAAAMNNLGILYAEGLGSLKQSYERAAILFRASAKQHVSEAYFNLGEIYARGLSVPRDIVRAAGLYYQAAMADTNADAEFNLANIFLTGKDELKQNWVIAQYWFEQAALHGHHDARNNILALGSVLTQFSIDQRHRAAQAR